MLILYPLSLFFPFPFYPKLVKERKLFFEKIKFYIPTKAMMVTSPATITASREPATLPAPPWKVRRLVASMMQAGVDVA